MTTIQTPQTDPGQIEPPKTAKAPLAAVLASTTFGLGFSPLAPGTLGSAAGVGLIYLTLDWPLPAKIGVLVFVTLLGWWASAEVGKVWGHDHRRIVIDEVAGQYLTLILSAGSSAALFTGFILFRIFDMWKPPPARAYDNRKGGWFTMADDLAAGVYGLFALILIERFLLT